MQLSPSVQLDLADYACQDLLVSFAVTNKAGLSNFSLPAQITVHGGKTDWIFNSFANLVCNDINQPAQLATCSKPSSWSNHAGTAF